MSNPQQFDKATLRALRNRLNMALAEVSEDFGITLKAGNCRFTSMEATFKVHATINTTNASGEVIAPERAALLRMLPAMRLTEKALERRFFAFGHWFKLVGYDAKRRTKPMVIEREDGKRFIAEYQRVLDALKLDYTK